MYDLKLSIWPAPLKSASNSFTNIRRPHQEEAKPSSSTKLEDVQELLFKLLWITAQISSAEADLLDCKV
jgi:hypothetical protein